MISALVREQKRYTQEDLCKILDCSEEKAVPLIRKLKECGVLKTVKTSGIQRDMSELSDMDIEVAEVEAGEDAYLYVFTYVGVIVVAGRVLKCCPKYLLHAGQPEVELRQILKVLEKYNAREQIVRMFSDSGESGAFNLLAVLLFLLQDYYENGIYSNTEDIVESNGSGEILWDKTIEENFMFLSRGRPYYTQLRTKRRITDDFDYFRRLHACIVARASKELKAAGLLDLFEMTEADLPEEELDNFGDKESVLYRIERELNTRFNTRKQLVLKALYAYVGHSGSLYDADCLSLFGTNRFNLVWEGVCADIMDNQLDVKLGSLQLPGPLKPGYDRNQKLIELIEKPLWTAAGKKAGDTLIPDLITIKGSRFIIFDAKYYMPRLEAGTEPKGQPGIEAVTKQYLYQLAYQRFLADHAFTAVINCFLMPTENKEIEERGEVSMEMFSALGLQNIQVRFLPADMVFDYYLTGRKMDVGMLGF